MARPPIIAAREEFLNTLSHGAGLVAALAMTPVLIYGAVLNGGPTDIVGASIFGATLVVLYFASTAYHATRPGPWKDRLQRLDHAAIYLLIAGTYTPFTLGPLAGAWGWSLFGVVWGIAVLGVAFKLVFGDRYPRISMAGYLMMGWLAVIAIKPFLSAMPIAGLAWVAAGGLAYSAGVYFYAQPNRRYAHFIWHLFVLAGSACHVVAVLGYAAG